VLNLLDMPVSPQQEPAHILLINQFFWPDGAPTALLLEDVAKELTRLGCRVTVICSHGSYHESRHDQAPPVRILKAPGLPYSRTRPGRLFNWVMFLVWASVRSLFVGHVDLVVTMTTPPGLSVIGAALKWLRRSRFWIWEMDLYPDVATALGAIESNSLPARVIGSLMHASRRQADGIIAIGSCMRDRLLDHDFGSAGLNPGRVVVAENWSDSGLIRATHLPAGGPLRVLYSGNLGLAHETDTVGQVILRLRNSKKVHFTFAGGGSRQQEIKTLCELHRIENVSFEPYVERNKLSERLAHCHVGLVTLRPGCEGTLVPSKVYSLLAAGRPILYIGPEGSTLGGIVGDGCGWHREPGDVEGVLSLLEQMISDPELLVFASIQARRIFSSTYDKPHGVGRVVGLLLSSVEADKWNSIRHIRPETQMLETELFQDSASK
jgi:colanic acid biosynthesis glycosyl transferase WcaI